MRITNENHGILRRLQNKKSQYNVEKWEVEREVMEHKIHQMSEFNAPDFESISIYHRNNKSFNSSTSNIGVPGHNSQVASGKYRRVPKMMRTTRSRQGFFAGNDVKSHSQLAHKNNHMTQYNFNPKTRRKLSQSRRSQSQQKSIASSHEKSVSGIANLSSMNTVDPEKHDFLGGVSVENDSIEPKSSTHREKPMKLPSSSTLDQDREILIKTEKNMGGPFCVEISKSKSNFYIAAVNYYDSKQNFLIELDADSGGKILKEFKGDYELMVDHLHIMNRRMILLNPTAKSPFKGKKGKRIKSQKGSMTDRNHRTEYSRDVSAGVRKRGAKKKKSSKLIRHEKVPSAAQIQKDFEKRVSNRSRS